MQPKLTSRLAALILACSLALPLHAAVWENTAQWDHDWELRFSDWIRERFGSDFFTRGRYAGIPHDCADSAYFARLAFAYEHGLPFVIRDPAWQGEHSQRGASFTQLVAEHGSDSPYAVVRPFISNDMDDFDHVQPPARLRAFIDFVGAVVWTRSLVDDTYPVRVDREWFRPGVVAVLPRRQLFDKPNPFFDSAADIQSAGHAQIVTDIDEQGVIHYLKSTMPARIQGLRPTTLNSFNPAPEGGSFRYWKQPQHYAQSEHELPGYGTEQFQVDGSFEDAVQPLLAQRRESRDARLTRLGAELCDQLQQRAPLVLQAWRHKLAIGEIHCMTYEEYDIHSTPLRDAKIRATVERLLQAAGGEGALDEIVQRLSAQCPPIEYLPGLNLDAGEALRAMHDGSASSDPNQPPAVRWGLQAARRQDCPIYY